MTNKRMKQSVLSIILMTLCHISYSMSQYKPDQFFIAQKPTACTPDGSQWIFEYLGFWYQSPKICYRYLLRTESHDQAPCTDVDQQTYIGTDYHITLELPLIGCQDDIEEFVTKLFKDPFPFLIVQHQDQIHLQFEHFSYYEWNAQYAADGGQLYTVCLTNFELGTTSFNGRALLTADSDIMYFDEMEVPNLCSVFDHKFEESQGSIHSISTDSQDTIVELNVSDSNIYESYEWQSGPEFQVGQGGVDEYDISDRLMPPRDVDEGFQRQGTNFGGDGLIDADNDGDSVSYRKGNGFRRTDALTEEEWAVVLNQRKTQQRKSVGDEGWKEIVDSFHEHNETNLEYPGRRLLQKVVNKL